MDSCLICLSSPPTVTFHPCSHTHLCATCATRLEHASCPTCRQPIFNATFSTAKPAYRDFKRLIQARHARDKAMLSRTMQVLVIGPRDAEELSNRMIGRILQLYDTSSVETTFWKKPRTVMSKMQWFMEEEIVDELSGLSYTSRFEGNAMVDGERVRFSWLAFPPNKQTSRGWVADVKALKPDFLLLTSSVQLRSSFAEMLAYDRRLRNVMGTALPRRMWVFLAPPKSSPFSKPASSMKGGQNLNFNDDVAKALSSMSELYRPLTYHVLEPGSMMKGRLRKVAVRSVFHAKLARGDGGAPPVGWDTQLNLGIWA